MDYFKIIEEHSDVIEAMKAECMQDISRFAEACREAIATGQCAAMFLTASTAPGINGSSAA